MCSTERCFLFSPHLHEDHKSELLKCVSKEGLGLFPWLCSSGREQQGPLQRSDLKRWSFLSQREGQMSRRVTHSPWGQAASLRDPVQQHWQSMQSVLRFWMQTIARISLAATTDMQCCFCMPLEKKGIKAQRSQHYVKAAAGTLLARWQQWWHQDTWHAFVKFIISPESPICLHHCFSQIHIASFFSCLNTGILHQFFKISANYILISPQFREKKKKSELIKGT